MRRSPGPTFSVAGTTCSVRATIGYAIAPMDGTDATSLLKAADAAMYDGKQAGKNRVIRRQPATVSTVG